MCKTALDSSEFYAEPRTKDGLSGSCKPCTSTRKAAAQKLRRKNPEATVTAAVEIRLAESQQRKAQRDVDKAKAQGRKQIDKNTSVAELEDHIKILGEYIAVRNRGLNWTEDAQLEKLGFIIGYRKDSVADLMKIGA